MSQVWCCWVSRQWFAFCLYLCFLFTLIHLCRVVCNVPSLPSLVLSKFPDSVVLSVFIGISFCSFIHIVVPCIHQVYGEDQVAFPNFRNLRTLFLDNCDLCDNFKTLEHFLKNSPDLEKLTLRCCKVYCTLAF